MSETLTAEVGVFYTNGGTGGGGSGAAYFDVESESGRIGRAVLTARLGAARLGASRLGFTPKDTNAYQTPGAAGPYYIWRTVPLPTNVWTEVIS